jgi:hypothetical protein
MEDRTKDEEPRNEDPQTMGGAVGGATGAAAAAAAGIAIAGPIGGVIGLLAGAAGGWWGGKELTESIEDADREDNRFRRAHEHAGATRPYEEIRHAYQLGYLAGRNPDYADATWSRAEEDLRTAWNGAHKHDREHVRWDDVRDSARRGYELSRGD